MGGCDQWFQTPVEHLVACPQSLTESSMQAGNTELTGLPIDTPLNGKVPPAGCEDAYYLCSSDDREEHKIRICGKNNREGGDKCGTPYRNCENPKQDHEGWWWNTGHNEIASNLIIGPLDGLFNAAPGDSHTALLSLDEPYYFVNWYVKAPGNTSARGTLERYVSSDGTQTESTFSYTFPSGAMYTGDYVITAYYYLWSSDPAPHEESYTVNVSISSDVAVVDNTPDCDFCTDGCSSCPITYGCGVHSGHPGNASGHSLVPVGSWSWHCTTHAFYACDAANHTGINCYATDINGNTCTVDHYWACQSHTHTFSCSNGTCSVQVSDREEHRRTCINGHQYWSCNTQSMGNDYHRTRNACTRMKWARSVWNPRTQRYEAVWEACGESWAMCDRNGQGCRNIYGAIGYHQE